ncbi:uncharacterized protein BJ212DRAFT_1486358 [Suillus subaureus]|uniref:Uncharacterized protein n=1 Tax=Suillus subaureus TaxID=48587 RepID=A0A9P7DXB3_9AGAM|nr:uncharacterized protein BJ212DRAFT_1486358 [Suillus subaureus]KAG1805437.1 hypothetical protein BJ212DRAFT_1486358 [Suillus subaureus]
MVLEHNGSSKEREDDGNETELGVSHFVYDVVGVDTPHKKQINGKPKSNQNPTKNTKSTSITKPNEETKTNAPQYPRSLIPSPNDDAAHNSPSHLRRADQRPLTAFKANVDAAVGGERSEEGRPCPCPCPGEDKRVVYVFLTGLLATHTCTAKVIMILKRVEWKRSGLMVVV